MKTLTLVAFAGLMLMIAANAHGQLPDAPSIVIGDNGIQSLHVSPSEVTHEGGGMHCWRGTDIGALVGWEEVPCSSMPEIFAPPPATFWTFRKSFTAPPLRTNRQTFNKKFLILHGMAAAALIFACKNPRSGETWASEVPAVAVVTGFDYIASRFFTEAMSVEAPVYMIQHYARASAK